MAVDRGELTTYYRITASLGAALLKMMMPEGPVSDLFARPATVPMRRGRPAVYDVSSIKDTEPICRPPRCRRAGPTGSPP